MLSGRKWPLWLFFWAFPVTEQISKTTRGSKGLWREELCQADTLLLQRKSLKCIRVYVLQCLLFSENKSRTWTILGHRWVSWIQGKHQQVLHFQWSVFHTSFIISMTTGATLTAILAQCEPEHVFPNNTACQKFSSTQPAECYEFPKTEILSSLLQFCLPCLGFVLLVHS